MKMVGFFLIAIGILSLAYGGFSYAQHRKVSDIRALGAPVDQPGSVPLSPVVGGIALMAGYLALLTDRRRA